MSELKKINFFVFCILLFTVLPSLSEKPGMGSLFAQSDGDLDINFGAGGKVITDIEMVDFGNSVAIQSDGKIVVVGRSCCPESFSLTRYNSDGSLDNTFSSDGIVTSEAGIAESVAIQPDGKIVVVCWVPNDLMPSDFKVLRFNSNGNPDSTFGFSGIVSTLFGGDAFSVAIQPDGKIVVAGSSSHFDSLFYSNQDIVLARYNINGTFDTTFDSDGRVITDFGGDESGNSVTIQSDGKIIVAGTILIRYNTNGSIDSTFNINPGGNSVVLQSDEKIVVAGTLYDPLDSNYNFALSRYNTDGTPDIAFGSNGEVFTDIGEDDYGNSAAVQTDGKIIIAGTSDANFALARYDPNGSIDTTFGSGGKVITDFVDIDVGNSVAIQQDGKIVVAGYTGDGFTFDFAVVRYLCCNPVSVEEISPEQPNVSIYPNPGSGLFTVSCTSEILEIEITDLVGNTVYKRSVVSSNSAEIDLSAFPKGYYVLRGSTQNKIYCGKLVIQ